MAALEAFDFLVLGLLEAPIERVQETLQDILETTQFSISTRPLDVSWAYVGRPSPGGAEKLRAVLFAPENSQTTTAFVPNRADAWLTLFNVLGKRIPGRHMLVRSDATGAFPVNEFRVWANGMAVRSVSAMRDDNSWEFVAKGAPLDFEDPTQYKKRNIAERLTRDMILQYLVRLGWCIAAPGFWSSAKPAVYVEELRSAT